MIIHVYFYIRTLRQRYEIKELLGVLWASKKSECHFIAQVEKLSALFLLYRLQYGQLFSSRILLHDTNIFENSTSFSAVLA